MTLHANFSVAQAEKPHSQHYDNPLGKAESRGETVAEPYEEDSKAVRKLLMKLDFTILPFAVLLYLSAYLDRGNLWVSTVYKWGPR